ncbi:MAG TPA: hypothetical protein VFF65_05490, partial [Phycisphaerales bacterium]|nr:hypothetical protein [Phycisphaerales bacterium]
MRPRHARAFHIIDLVLVLVVVVAVVAAIIVLNRGTRRTHGRTLKDGLQIRNIVQAMTIFAQGNQERFPLPSILDADNTTVADVGRARDTTSNILSILIYNSSISPELCYSPSETNSAIAVHGTYDNARPATAVDPDKALWDPAFRCDFTTGTGHTSYATAMTDGDPGPSFDKATGRLARWGATFNATEAVVGNRGPLVTGRDAAGNPAFNSASNTLRIH